jgi:hypothetical protein
MTTANPCSVQTFPTPRFDALHPMETAREYLAKALQDWRDRRALRATWSMLEGLNDSTRRDLGLGERRLDAPAARSLGWAGGPWL